MTNILGIAHGDSVHAVAEIIHDRSEREKRSSRKVFIVLKPLERLKLNLITFEKFENALSVQKVAAQFSWRTTRFRFAFKRTIEVNTSVADIRAMKQSAKSN